MSCYGAMQWQLTAQHSMMDAWPKALIQPIRGAAVQVQVVSFMMSCWIRPGQTSIPACPHTIRSSQ